MSIKMSKKAKISIHALREEGDLRYSVSTSSALNFYPRPPRGGRQYRAFRDLKRLEISIHALREEGDLAASVAVNASVTFLSTPSARRAT